MTDTPNNSTSPNKTPSPANVQPQQDWMEEDDIIRTEIPDRKRSGFDRVAFVAELKKNTPEENGKFIMGISKSNPSTEFGKHTRARKKTQSPSPQQPLPRTQIRGIHHGAPLKVYLGALITVLFYGAIALFAFEFLLIGLTFKIGIEDILILAFLLIMIVLFVTGARSCRCGICKSPFFCSGKMNTHESAHSLPIFGKNLPTALHALFLLWLRCPACGTPTRLLSKKEDKQKD